MLRPELPVSRSLSSIADQVGAIAPDLDLDILGMTNVSSEIEEGDLFLAFAGKKVHGASYWKEAKALGARAVLTDAAGALLVQDFPTVVVADPRRSSGNLSSWFYGEPMRDMFSVGITGTNGKTTTSTLLYQMWSYVGREAGLIGTVETRIGRDG
ncbi:MAG: UDP-N-acetylmuramyl tripeptide synthase, partial [Actinobacteria bacterium]|nr:UDP-N-acetylmuramyl tripeptide synthase [Actinomycetota bacterium]